VGKRLWKLLAGGERATAAEIAGEVVDMEGRLPALRAELAAAHEAAVAAAQRRLAGAPGGAGKEAAEGEAAGRLMVEAAERTLDELRAKLAAAVEAESAAELAPLDAELRKLDEERAAAVAEVRRCVVALCVACYHLEPWKVRHARGGLADKLAARTPLLELAPLVREEPGPALGGELGLTYATLPHDLVEAVEDEVRRQGLEDAAGTLYARTGAARKRRDALAAVGVEERVKAALAAAREKQRTGGTEEHVA